MGEFDEIKKLHPAERAKKLKELIEKRNKELEEAKKLSKQAEDETEEIIALQEKIEVPEIEPIDISDLFEQGEENLEDTVKKEAPPDEAEVSLYQISPEMATSQMYAEVANLYSAMNQDGRVSKNMAAAAGAISYAMEQKKDDVEQGGYQPTSENFERQVNLIKNMADKILSMYTAGVKRKNGI